MAHPFAFLSTREDVSPCCRPDNLDITERPNDVLRGECRTCHRGHLVMIAKGMHIRGLIQSLGEVTQTPSGLLVPKA